MAYQKLQVSRAAVVTPSNTADIVSPSGGPNEGCVLYVGTGGILRVLTAGGDDITFQGVPNGTFIPSGSKSICNNHNSPQYCSTMVIGIIISI